MSVHNNQQTGVFPSRCNSAEQQRVSEFYPPKFKKCFPFSSSSSSSSPSPPQPLASSNAQIHEDLITHVNENIADVNINTTDTNGKNSSKNNNKSKTSSTLTATAQPWYPTHVQPPTYDALFTNSSDHVMMPMTNTPFHPICFESQEFATSLNSPASQSLHLSRNNESQQLSSLSVPLLAAHSNERAEKIIAVDQNKGDKENKVNSVAAAATNGESNKQKITAHANNERNIINMANRNSNSSSNNNNSKDSIPEPPQPILPPSLPNSPLSGRDLIAMPHSPETIHSPLTFKIAITSSKFTEEATARCCYPIDMFLSARKDAAHTPRGVLQWCVKLYNKYPTLKVPRHLEISTLASMYDMYGTTRGIISTELKNKVRIKPARHTWHKVMSILSRVTEAKYNELLAEMKELPLRQSDDVELHDIVNVFFDKAIKEPKYSELYAKFIHAICNSSELEHGRYAEQQNNEQQQQQQKYTNKLLSTRIKRELIRACEEEFKKPIELNDDDRVDRNTGEALDEEEIENRESRLKNRLIGNIKFVGELNKINLISDKIIEHVLERLVGTYEVSQPLLHEEYLFDGFAKLIETVGPTLFTRQPEILKHFVAIANIICITHPRPRVRFSMMDLNDLNEKHQWFTFESIKEEVKRLTAEAPEKYKPEAESEMQEKEEEQELQEEETNKEKCTQEGREGVPMQSTNEQTGKSCNVNKVISPSYSTSELPSCKELSELGGSRSKCSASSPLLEIKLTPTDEQHVSEGETHTFNVPPRQQSTSSRTGNSISVSNCNTNGSYSVNEWNEVHQHGTFLSRVNSHTTFGAVNELCEPNSAVTTVPELIHSSSRMKNNNNNNIATNTSFSSPTSYESSHSADNGLVQDYNFNNNNNNNGNRQQHSPQPPSHHHHHQHQHQHQHFIISSSHNTHHSSSSHNPSLHTHPMYNTQATTPYTRLSLSEVSLSSLPEASSPSSSSFTCFGVSSPMQTRHTHSANDVSALQMACFRSKSDAQLSERSKCNDAPYYPPQPQPEQIQYYPEEHQTPLSDRNSTSKSSTSFSHNPYAYIPFTDSNEEQEEQHVNEFNINNANNYNTNETGTVMSFVEEEYQNVNLYNTGVNYYGMPSSSVPLPPSPIGTVNSNTTLNVMAESYVGYQNINNNNNNINYNSDSYSNNREIHNYTQYMPSNINTQSTTYHYNKNSASNNNNYNIHKNSFNNHINNNVNSNNNNNNYNKKKGKFYNNNSTTASSALISPCPVGTTPDTPITPFIQFCEVSNSRGNSEGERTPMANFKQGHGAVMTINMREVALQLIQRFANTLTERKVLHCLQNMELKYKIITLTWWLRIIITDTSHRSDLERIPHLLNSLIFRCNSLSPAQLLSAIIEWLRCDVERREYIHCTRLFYNLAILITSIQNFADVDHSEMLMDYLHNHNEPEQITLLLPPSVVPIQSKKSNESTELQQRQENNKDKNINNNNSNDKSNNSPTLNTKCDASIEEASIQTNLASKLDKCKSCDDDDDAHEDGSADQNKKDGDSHTTSNAKTESNSEAAKVIISSSIATKTTTTRDKETEPERTRRAEKYKRLVYNFYSGSLYKPCFELIPIGICNVVLHELVSRREFTQGVTFIKTVLPSMNELLHKSEIINNATSEKCTFEQLLRIVLLCRFRVLHYLTQMSDPNRPSVSAEYTLESLSLSFTHSVRPNSELTKIEDEVKESECNTHEISSRNEVCHNASMDSQNGKACLQSDGRHVTINNKTNEANKSISGTCHKECLANSFIRQCFEVPKVCEDVEIALYHTLCQRNEEVYELKREQFEIEKQHSSEKANSKENVKELLQPSSTSSSRAAANIAMSTAFAKSASELRPKNNSSSNNSNNNSRINNVKEEWKDNIINYINLFNYHDQPILQALHIMKATSALLTYSHHALFSRERLHSTSTSTSLDKCNANAINGECVNKEERDATEVIDAKLDAQDNDNIKAKTSSAKNEKESADVHLPDLQQSTIIDDTAFTDSEQDEIFAALLKRNRGHYSALMQAAMVLELLLFCSAVMSKKRHVPRESRVHLFQQIVDRWAHKKLIDRDSVMRMISKLDDTSVDALQLHETYFNALVEPCMNWSDVKPLLVITKET